MTVDASTSEVIAVIGAVGSVLLTPIVGLVTLWLNQKFNAEVVALKERVAACEARHAALDATKADGPK